MPTAPSAEPSGRPPRASLGPLILAAAIGFLAGDALRPPDRQVIARVAVAAIDGYRSAVSPRLAATGLVRCRFTPSCSAYGREAIARYGSPKGFALTAGRILRCHPWAKGGEDPVPVP
jgi:putative membrane protein insertion efficiency factor